MANEIRRRAACDRCHSQKTRCRRQDRSEICDRCKKARTPCVFAPFRQKKTPGECGEGEVDTIASILNFRNQVSEQANGAVGLGRRKRKRVTHSPNEFGPSHLSEPGLTTKHLAPDAISIERHVEIAGLDTDPLVLDWLPSSFTNVLDTAPDIAFENFNFGTTDQYAIDFSNMTPEHPENFSFTNEVPYRKNAKLDRPFRGQSNLLHGAYLSRPNPDVSSWENIPAQFTWSDTQSMKVSGPSSIPNFIRRLSQLNIDLSDHKSTLPPLSIHDEVSPEMEIGTPSNQYVLGDILRHTQSLIELYPRFLDLFINPRPASQITTPDSDFLSTDKLGSDGSSSSDAASPSAPLGIKPVFDHASVLLMISCHLRVIDIYDILFKHMETCISQKGMVKNAKQAALTAPTLSIGNYIPPPSSAVPMQMLLLVQFASRLCDYAVDLASEIPFPQDRSSSGGIVDSTLLLTKAAAGNIKERATDMSQRLGSLRGEMLQFGLLA